MLTRRCGSRRHLQNNILFTINLTIFISININQSTLYYEQIVKDASLCARDAVRTTAGHRLNQCYQIYNLDLTLECRSVFIDAKTQQQLVSDARYDQSYYGEDMGNRI